MIWFLLVVLIFLCIFSVRVRLVVFHPISCVCYACADVFLYFKQHRYDWYEAGNLNCYVADVDAKIFGSGKTLTMVHDALAIFKRYNNKRVFDRRRGLWVTQKVLILSNAVINVEGFQYLEGLKQFVECAKYNEILDIKYNTRTIVLGCIDEASVQLNSRNFKNNIDFGFLSTLLTCRHFAIDFYVTSQKFSLCDALLRSVTQYVIGCKKTWRLVTRSYYSAHDVENASSLSLLKPLSVTGYFCRNSDYSSYDTYAVVENLEKATNEGAMLSEQEILSLRGDFYSDNGQIIKGSRKFKRMQKRKG